MTQNWNSNGMGCESGKNQVGDWNMNKIVDKNTFKELMKEGK